MTSELLFEGADLTLLIRESIKSFLLKDFRSRLMQDAEKKEKPFNSLSVYSREEKRV